MPCIFAILASDGGNTLYYPQHFPLSTGAHATPAIAVSYTHLVEARSTDYRNQARSSTIRSYQMWTMFCVQNKSSYLSRITVENQYKYLADTVTPLWNYTYEEQLKHKHLFAQNVVEKLKLWTRNSVGSACTINNVIPSVSILYDIRFQFNLS